MNELEEDIPYQPLDIDLIRQNIAQYSSEKLADMIVVDRYLHCYREVAIICMQELACRRNNGEIFSFEEYIDQALQKLPKLNLGKLAGLNLKELFTKAANQKGI
jgi:hypothetical protein